MDTEEAGRFGNSAYKPGHGDLKLASGVADWMGRGYRDSSRLSGRWYQTLCHWNYFVQKITGVNTASPTSL